MMTGTNAILAALITPAMAYAGLAAAALPVLIHLFNRRRFRRIRWAATDFLLEAERRNRRRMRLEEFILLALRCLAMALLGLALARWFVQPRSLIASLGSAGRADHIIVVDDSYSMGALKDAVGNAEVDLTDDAASRDTGRVFDEAKRAVQRLIEHIGQVAPDDSLTLFLTSRPDEPVRTASSLRQVPPQSWNDDIRAMRLSSRAGNMPGALQAARNLLDARQDTTRAAVYIVSDFQQIDWIPASRQENRPVPTANNESTHTSGPADILAGWADRRRSLEVLLVDVGREVPHNLSVASIRSDQSQAVSGVVGRYHIRVENYGTQPSGSGELRVFMGDTALPAVLVPALAPNQSAEVPVELAFGQEGSQRLTVQLGADVLPADNVRYAAVDVERALRLLIVNGEASSDPYEDEAFLLNVALRPEGPEFSGNETTIINEDEFEVADLGDYHAVMLLNVNRVTHEMAGRLEQFASAGGGVAFFLGDQVDATTYNRLLFRNGTGVLPVQLGEQITVPMDQPGVNLAQGGRSESDTMPFAVGTAPLLRDALVWQYFGTQDSSHLPTAPASAPAISEGPPDHTATSLPESRSESQNHRPPARTLLRLNDAEQSPLLIERPFGRGRILLCTTSADKEWNNLPDQPVYVVLILELAQYIARSSEASTDQFIGEPIRLALDPATFEPSALLKLPTYPGTPAVRLDSRLGIDTGQALLEWTATDRPGIYQFDLRKLNGDEMTRQAAVNLDPREADLRRADRNRLLGSMAGLDVAYVTGATLADRARAEARQELWPALLVVLVFVLMLEQGLAWWFGADRSWRRAMRWTA